MKQWRQFTKWIPDDDSLVIGDIRIPSSVIESWQRWLEERGHKTEIRTLNGRRAMYIFDHLENGDSDNER
jgi:hypothetical protein